jgi:tRNA threonylcarbamoyladenosine biosynthesis protein TsaB
MEREWLLAVETSVRPGGVALVRGGQVVAERAVEGWERGGGTDGGGRGGGLVAAVASLLAEAGLRLSDVGVVCYSSGPGSFTGLRVAATFARLAAAASGCRVVAASTLEVIARNALSRAARDERFVVLLDAKRDRAYAAVYERVGNDELRCIAPPGLRVVCDLVEGIDLPAIAIGSQLSALRDALLQRGVAVADELLCVPRVAQLAWIGARLAREGAFQRPEEVAPVYSRPPECEAVYEQRRSEARRRRGQ